MSKVVIESRENGSNHVIVDGKDIIALCRCGHSKNKPYCDGTHHSINFKAAKAEVKVL